MGAGFYSSRTILVLVIVRHELWALVLGSGQLVNAGWMEGNVVEIILSHHLRENNEDNRYSVYCIV